MTHSAKESTEWAIKELVSHCEKILLIFKNNNEYMIANQHMKITENNQALEVQMKEISALIDLIQKNHPQGLKNQLTTNSLSEKSCLETSLNKLNEMVMLCQKNMEINYHTIKANLMMLKEIWDKIISPDSQHIYEISKKNDQR